MNKRTQFLTFLSVSAVAEDIRAGTRNAAEIVRLAATVPEEKIPECPANAAKAFMAYCGGVTERPFAWMLPDQMD